MGLRELWKPSARPDSTARVEVHLVRLASLLDSSDPYTLLPESERRRACNIAFLPRRSAFLATRVLLRKLLAARLRCPPREVPIQQEKNGKPRLAWGQIEFSLSHPEGWCAVALSKDCAVGVDAEPIRPLAGMTEVVTQFFPLEARAHYIAAPPERRQDVFFHWWTCLEAAVKVSGSGLDESPSFTRGLWFESCATVPGLALAVAADSSTRPSIDWIIHN